MKKLFTSLLVFAGVLAISADSVKAEVRLPKIISSGMVIQRNDTARIWGTADAGEPVTVTFLKKKYKTIADEDGVETVFSRADIALIRQAVHF